MALTKDNVKTPDELKQFLREETSVRNPKLLASFEEIWQVLGASIKDEHAVQKFLEGYTKC